MFFHLLGYYAGEVVLLRNLFLSYNIFYFPMVNGLKAKVYSVGPGLSVFLEGEIKGKRLQLCIDIGTQVLLLDYRYWQRQYTGSSEEIKGYKKKIYTANRGHLEIEVKWEVSCNFDGLLLNIDFLVAKNLSQPSLVGMDFLKKKIVYRIGFS